jgi:hypothetical protein
MNTCDRYDDHHRNDAAAAAVAQETQYDNAILTEPNGVCV